MSRLIYCAVWVLLLSSCALRPTRVLETKMPESQLQELRSEAQMEGTVILDTRTPLEFYANKVPGSIQVEWKDFTMRLPGAEGVLDKEPLNITRRLALWGIDQSTKVIVLGKIDDTKPEETATFGRVAWMLHEMGVQQVKTFNYEMFRREVPGLNEAPPKNKSMWMPIGEGKSEVMFDEFQRMIFPFNYKFNFFTLKTRDEKVGLRVGRIKNVKIHYLDVRSEKEFLADSLKTRDADFQIHNIEWRQFYTQEGIVNYSIKTQLEKLGIHENDIVVCISNQGVRSGAVTFALEQLGYGDAKNFSGGYNYLSNSLTLEKQINAVFFEKSKKKTRRKKYRSSKKSTKSQKSKSKNKK
ncbi:MAG: hypothetical protein KDD45_03650 [Bdellovibrionales bacterium]|nr:hypothetical protein [Bdellovibrionales bacterium]